MVDFAYFEVFNVLLLYQSELLSFMCTNVANEVYDELCVEEVFKCYETKECQGLSLGMPRCTPKKY